MIWAVAGADSMRALDAHTIGELGVPGELLMESAGRAVVDEVLAALPEGGQVLVVCGGGNNGGDGFVVARHLHVLGVPVRIALLAEERKIRGDAAANWKRAKKLGIPLDGPRWRAPATGVVVDAVFGTGLARDVEGPAAASLRRINAARDSHAGSLRVVAVDMPSGLCSDTGRVLGVAVRADVTVAIQLPKLGLVLEPGRSCAGRIAIARIGIAEAAPGVELPAELWTRAAAGERLPERPRSGHKGTFGHALVVAGSEGKTGAAALAAEGAARVGAGLVTIACPAGLNDVLEIKCTEAMTVPVADTTDRALASSAAEQVASLAAERDAVGLGPGVGRDAETQKLLLALAERIDKPLAIDADGLFPFAAEPGLLVGRRAPTVLTPHPGEAAHLLGTTAAEVNGDRVAAARRLADATGAVVLLKGAATVTAAPEGAVVVNPTGGPALGSGGTGDVLLGTVTGFLSQGLDARTAAALAAFVHGAAADAIALRTGDSGLLAGDLAREIPATCESLRAARSAQSSLALSFPEP